MKDGGSAFPVFAAVRAGADYDMLERGMTLRDWFAGQALAGSMTERLNFLTDEETIRYAEEAYMLADAMLAQREKEEQ